MKIVASTSLPAVDRPNAGRWNAARSRQYKQAGLCEAQAGSKLATQVGQVRAAAFLNY